MTILRISLIFGGVAGFLAIAFGAYAEHVLRPVLSVPDFENSATALRYQLLHSAFLTGIGTLQFFNASAALIRRLQAVALLFMAGIILFCGSILVGVLTAFHEVFQMAPVGGFAFMLGWLVLASAGFIPIESRKNEARTGYLNISRRRR